MAPFPLSVFDDHHQRNRNQQKRMQRQHQNKHKRNHQQHQHQIMELKTYKDFKKQLVAKSKATSSSTRKMDKNCNDNINKRSIPSDFNSYPHDDLNSAEDRSSSNGKKTNENPRSITSLIIASGWSWLQREQRQRQYHWWFQ